MFKMMLKKNAGIALVQVLIISIVLSMLAIFITQTVKQQIDVTQSIQTRTKLATKIESVEANILHLLATNHLSPYINHQNNVLNNWNFYGKPFNYDENTTIVIQDKTSLLSLNYTNKRLTLRILDMLGLSPHETRTFMDSLADWKDKDDLTRLNGAESGYYLKEGIEPPRNGYLQSLEEVQLIKFSDKLTFEQWKKYFSVELVSQFNPLNAPDLVLKAFISDDETFNQVYRLRNERTLTSLRFYQLTGVEASDNLSLLTGNTLSVSIEVYVQGQRLKKSFQVEFNHKAPAKAVTLSNVVWNN